MVVQTAVAYIYRDCVFYIPFLCLFLLFIFIFSFLCSLYFLSWYYEEKNIDVVQVGHNDEACFP